MSKPNSNAYLNTTVLDRTQSVVLHEVAASVQCSSQHFDSSYKGVCEKAKIVSRQSEHQIDVVYIRKIR